MIECPQQALILVNRDHALPDNYAPDLVAIEGYPKMRCSRQCAPAVARFVADATAAGFHPLIVSAYRSRELQKRCLAHRVDEMWTQGTTFKEALAQAARLVAPPGASEHETGLAVDIRDEGYHGRDAGVDDAPGQRWLMSHCHEYGFILRYPPDKEHVTHIAFEPCHFRYVGQRHAAAMAERGLTLEEYLGAAEGLSFQKEEPHRP